MDSPQLVALREETLGDLTAKVSGHASAGIVTPIRICLTVAVLWVLVATPTRADKDNAWTPLFNGKDLDGWETWLGKTAEDKEPIGLNKDPNHVYTVVEVEGKPAIRITGENFGALASKAEYENYHLRIEFKWGEKRWPPREKPVRDSGLLYHSVGPHGAVEGFWMKSLECQIQEQDCGDLYSVGGPLVDVEGERKDGKGPVLFKMGGTRYTVPGKDSGGRRVVKSGDFENKTGEWITIEVLTVGQTAVHLVNGKRTMVVTNVRHKVGDKEEPLTKGKIQLQSEGAEVFYRGIYIKSLPKIPDEYLK
jgi:hypothetical protein